MNAVDGAQIFMVFAFPLALAMVGYLLKRSVAEIDRKLDGQSARFDSVDKTTKEIDKTVAVISNEMTHLSKLANDTASEVRSMRMGNGQGS